MKGKMVSLLVHLGLFAALSLLIAQAVSGQALVINELNLVVGPNTGQFVELYGEGGTPLDGHSIVFVKSSFQDGSFVPEVQAVEDLSALSLDDAGFVSISGSGWQSTVAAVVLAASPSSEFEVGTAPEFGLLLDAVLYGSLGVTHPQMQPLVELVAPEATMTVNESTAGSAAGPDGLSRVPDGGNPFDQNFVLQALSPGTTNVLPCEGGHLALNNPAVTTFCTDLGPSIVGFEHTSDAQNALTSLAVVQESTGEVLEVFIGTAINMEGFGDNTISVYAISHDTFLAEDWTSIDNVTTASGEGCVSVSPEPVVLFGETCEIPSCDGGTMLTAGGDPDAQACLTEDGALVSFGYYSDAVEGDHVFIVCDENDMILATTDVPYFDFASFESAGEYHVWGLSYQDGLDESTVLEGMPVVGASAVGCDSLSTNALQVSILECGSAGLCDDLIISEYVEGTSNNKALEIHNPTPFDVDLTPYVVEVYNNGSQVPIQSLDLEGVLAAGGVTVLGNPQATAAIVNQSQVLSTVTWFNGNDPIVLRKDGEIIDMMGTIGVDPMGAWAVGEGAMAEYTLVRKPDVGQGSVNWAEGQTQWDVYPQDTFDFLGEHSASCGGLGTMMVGFAAPELYVAEGEAVAVEMIVSYPLDDVQVEVAVTGGDATLGVDFPAVFPLNFTFESGLLNSQSFNFVAIDEEDPELQEDIELTLTLVSGEAIVGIQTLIIHILPSDLTYPVYDIAQVRGTTNQGVLDSIDTACELRGIVHGWNDYPQGLRFTLIDPTSGINVFSPINNFGYEVQEGDSVRVRGVVGQFAGLATIYADTLIYEGSDFPTQEPIQVSEMGEETESQIIKLKCVKLIDPSEWTNAFPYFDVLVDYGLGDVKIRIDGNTNIWGTEAPIGTFGVTGIGGQSDANLPYLDGYTLLPRSLDDLTEPVLAQFTVPEVLVLGGDTVYAENESLNADIFQWSFGNGSFSSEENPELAYTEPGTYNVYLTASSTETQCSDQTSATIFVEEGGEDLVQDLAKLAVSTFPNPVSNRLHVVVSQRADFVIRDASGRQITKGTWPRGKNEIEVSSWRSGTYTVEVDPLGHGVGIEARKFVVQH